MSSGSDKGPLTPGGVPSRATGRVHIAELGNGQQPRAASGGDEYEGDDAGPARIAYAPEDSNINQFRRFGQGIRVDHCALPFRPPITAHEESWAAMEARLPAQVKAGLDATGGRKGVNEILFMIDRAPVAWSFAAGGGHRKLTHGKVTQPIIDALVKDMVFDDLNRSAFRGQLHRVSITKTGKKATQVNLRVGRVISGPAWAFADLLAENRSVIFTASDYKQAVNKALELVDSLEDEELAARLRKELVKNKHRNSDFTEARKAWAFADLLAENRSVIFTAPPACGKTTVLRDVCRLLQDIAPTRKVVLIDRSDELGGSGDSAHPCLGEDVQVMRLNKLKPAAAITMAFRNQSPAVLIVDEIATAEEADALLAAKRAGVTVIATFHGNLTQFVRNKALRELSGRISSSTVGDLTAQISSGPFSKVKEEREEPPAFDTLVEMESVTQWAIYHDLEVVIDKLLEKGKHPVELRRIMPDGTLVTWTEVRELASANAKMVADGKRAAAAREAVMAERFLQAAADIAMSDLGKDVKGKGKAPVADK
ncbi:hypothetical protein HDU87_000683 [Geranomyces variabilis]|uniref:AAA+ ATPase domain-containing protein n=1 Tax=Geranomyces variabilis TaxID=109894 RepID=A0AAD5TNH7_9FUNG|nr:hypothetical protein HDU87_000683 [Geranomyces variabilis]